MEALTSPPSGVTLQPASQADLPRIAAFLSIAHPDAPVAVEELERLEAGRLEGEPFVRTLAVQGGEIAGLAETGVPRMDGHPGWLEVRSRARLIRG